MADSAIPGREATSEPPPPPNATSARAQGVGTEHAARSGGNAKRRAKRILRFFSTTLVVAGSLALVWAVVVWVWEDPFTALYTHFQQQRLAADYRKTVSHARPVRRLTRPELLPATLAREADAYARTLRTGHALGLITIGRIGLKMVVVQGTDESSLEKGPGHYVASGLPGQGRMIYIAGHRTTFLAPFANINDIRVGDYVELDVPYGLFTYRVVRHYVVPATDLDVLKNAGHEVLRLQACHPRFFATHRYIVDAVPVSVTLPGGARYRFGGEGSTHVRRQQAASPSVRRQHTRRSLRAASAHAGS